MMSNDITPGATALLPLTGVMPAGEPAVVTVEALFSVLSPTGRPARTVAVVAFDSGYRSHVLAASLRR